MMALWCVSWWPKSESGSISALTSSKGQAQQPHLQPTANVSLSVSPLTTEEIRYLLAVFREWKQSDITGRGSLPHPQLSSLQICRCF